ncbi:hypothetical protein ATCC90586_007236 [Pythium insidiosum]|nr:hypothetical protein ATCC90586_007236 [Pythium insidiosum]
MFARSAAETSVELSALEISTGDEVDWTTDTVSSVTANTARPSRRIAAVNVARVGIDMAFGGMVGVSVVGDDMAGSVVGDDMSGVSVVGDGMSGAPVVGDDMADVPVSGDDMSGKVYELVKRLLEAGIVEYSDSEWASPVVIVMKKNGLDIRLCIDYRQVNQLITLMSYPLPLIDEMLDNFDKAMWFLSFDMASGFWAISITRGDMCKKLDNLLYRLRYWRISVNLNKSKSAFGKRSIDYLSHEINREGIRATPKSAKSLSELVFPVTLKGMQSFLGSLNYYGKFIEGYASIASVLYELTDEQLRAGHDLEKAKLAFQLLKDRTKLPVSGVTVNEAEYEGLLRGLARAGELGIKRVVLVGDSRIAIQQCQGAIRCHESRLQALLNRFQALQRQFELVKLVHVKREYNAPADYLASRALQAGDTYVGDDEGRAQLSALNKLPERIMRPAPTDEAPPETTMPSEHDGDGAAPDASNVERSARRQQEDEALVSELAFEFRDASFKPITLAVGLNQSLPCRVE